MALLSSRSDGRDSAKGALSQMLREINGLKNRTQNRHKFLLISSTKYEILLASWPLTVALIKSAGFIGNLVEPWCKSGETLVPRSLSGLCPPKYTWPFKSS